VKKYFADEFNLIGIKTRKELRRITENRCRYSVNRDFYSMRFVLNRRRFGNNMDKKVDKRLPHFQCLDNRYFHIVESQEIIRGGINKHFARDTKFLIRRNEPFLLKCKSKRTMIINVMENKRYHERIWLIEEFTLPRTNEFRKFERRFKPWDLSKMLVEWFMGSRSQRSTLFLNCKVTFELKR
jgi:hypothetical protein